MAVGSLAEERPAADRPALLTSWASELYVLIVAGIATGVLVVGVGSRLAMLVLRLTSPAYVEGVDSDDGFTIGRFTLSGSYNLLLIGAAVGVLGAAAYQWVRPWLIGPRWFRLTTVALAAGAVVGSMLVHADGIDFRVLEPLWLAVGLFVALPAAFAACVAVAVDHVETRLASVGWLGWKRWVCAALLAIAFPLSLFVLVPGALVLFVWVAVRDTSPVRAMAGALATGVVARCAWFAIAVLGLFALIGDIADLRDVA
jgi:hypothetical protein